MERKEYSVALLVNRSEKSITKTIEVAGSMGITVETVPHTIISISEIEHSAWFKKLLTYDVLFIRDNMRNAVGERVISLLKNENKCLINEASPSAYSHRKIGQAVIAATFDIPHPKSFWGHHAQYKDIAAELGDTFVVKPDKGSQGTNVCIIDSQAAFDTYTQKVLTNECLIQELISDANEYRVYTIGGKGVASYKKVKASKDFRANLAVGGGSEKTESKIKSTLLDFAGMVSQKFNADIAGLDILMTDHGPLFLELNWQPTIVENIPNIDIHKLIHDYIQKKASEFYS